MAPGADFMRIRDVCRPFAMTSTERMHGLYQSLKYFTANGAILVKRLDSSDRDRTLPLNVTDRSFEKIQEPGPVFLVERAGAAGDSARGSQIGHQVAGCQHAAD